MDETQQQGDALDQALAEFDAGVAPAAGASPAGASPITANSRPVEAQGGGAAPVQDDGAFASGLRGAGDALSFGFLDELGGVADTLGGTAGRESVWNSNQSFSAVLAGNIAKNRAILAGDRENHFAATTAGNVVGGVLVPFGAGARGALQVAKVGAIQGGIYGIGSGEGVDGRLEEGVKGATIGGAVGALLGRFLPGLKTPKAGAAVEGAVEGAAAKEAAPLELVGDEVSATQPTAASPDGTSYATKLDDGSTLVGFDGDAKPVYAPAEVAPEVTSLSPPDQGAASLWLQPKEELERLAKEAPPENTVDEGEVSREMAQEILREHQPYQDMDTDNLVEIVRRTVIEQRDPQWMKRVTEGRDTGGVGQAAAVRMQGALGALKQRGYSMEALPGDLLTSLKKQGWNPADAEEVLGARLENMGRKALPAPEETVPLEAPPATPGAAPTQIGTIGRSELQAFKADIARIKGDPDLPADAPQGQWTIRHLGDNEDVPAVLGAMARTLPPSLKRTDLALAQSATEQARAVGEDPEAWLAYAQKAVGTLGDVDNMMMTMRAGWATMGRQVNDLHAANIDWAQADDSMVLQAGQAIRNLSAMSQQVQIAKAGLGRGLRVNALPDAETYLKTLLAKGVEGEEAAAGGAAQGGAEAVNPVAPRELPPLPRNRKEIADWMDLWGMTQGDARAQADFLQGTLTIPTPGKYLRTSVANLFTASILSAPRTIAMNIVGPSFISLVRNAERFGGAAAMSLNPFASAEERAAMREVARQTPTAYLRTLGDIGEAFRYGQQAADKNKSILGGGSSTTDALASYGPLTNNLLGATGTDPDMMYTLGNLINVFPKAFARLNNGLDETAKRLAYMGEVRVRAQVEAAQKGLTGDDFQGFVRDRLKGSFDEVGHAQDKKLLESAERTTFTAQVGEEGGYVRRFASGLQGMRRDIPEMRYIVPVFNVPANALGETLRRLPITKIPGVGEHLFPTTAADLAGENGVVAQADAHGRFLLGSSFLMAGVMMNRMGILTGAGPQEATDRKVWLQTHQPYSIRVGDEWVRYDKFDILGGLLSIPSTISDASTYRAADQGVGDMMMSGAGALAQWFKDRASLKTATAILNAGSDPTSDFGNVMSQFANSTAAGFIPAAFRTLTVDTTDPYVRMRRGWLDYMKASVPGLSQTLEPTRNVLGEPIQRSADTFAEAVFPVTMQSAVTYAEDPVMDELDRLYQTTGYGAGADPKSLGYGFFNPRDVKLEDGRSIYDRAMQKRMVMELDGKTLKQSLRELIDTADYNKAVDADSTQKVTSLGDASRGYMVRQVFDRYNKAAKAELANESPLADEYLTAAAAKQRDDAYLRDLSAEDLVKTPRLYQDRGINPANYSEKIKSGGGGGDPLMAALGL